MSKKDARKFIDHLHENAATRKEVQAAAKKVSDIAKAKGFKASPLEIRDALREHWSLTRRKADKHDKCAVPLSEAPGF